MVKRCIFCGKKLDKNDRCQNHDCPDYIRTQILESAEKPATSTEYAAYTNEK